MSSKKKRRHAEWLKREEKRKAKQNAEKRCREAMRSGDIERMAEVMGVRLR